MTQAYVPPGHIDPDQPAGVMRPTVIGAIAGIALVVAAGSYVAGRAARPDTFLPREARARVSISSVEPEANAAPQPVASAREREEARAREREEANASVREGTLSDVLAEAPSGSLAAAATPADAAELTTPLEAGTPEEGAPDAAPPLAAAADGAPPFESNDMRLVHPDVAAAVGQARIVRQMAEDAAHAARDAADRARDGGEGARVITYDTGDVYQGEVSATGREGVGVYVWANAREGDYAGEFREDAMDGLGVKSWADGATYYGDRRQEAREGYGVFVYADGGGYEGQWLGGAPDGYGVVWTSDGEVRAQGLWSGNTLVEAYVVPPPGEE